MPDIQSLPYLMLPLGCRFLLSSVRCWFPLKDKNTVQLCRCFLLFIWTVWVSPHSVHDGIYFALACALTRCYEHSSSCWSAGRCSLGELPNTRPVMAGWGTAVAAYVGLSLVWIGLGWTEQGGAGTSSGQKLNLSAWLNMKARAWGVGESDIMVDNPCFFAPPLSACVWVLWFIGISFSQILLNTEVQQRTTEVVNYWPPHIWSQHSLGKCHEMSSKS